MLEYGPKYGSPQANVESVALKLAALVLMMGSRRERASEVEREGEMGRA
jgi:hypothetical protein